MQKNRKGLEKTNKKQTVKKANKPQNTKKTSQRVSKRTTKKSVSQKPKKEEKNITKKVAIIVSLFLLIAISTILVVINLKRPVYNEVQYDANEQIITEPEKEEKRELIISNASPDVDLDAERSKYKNDDIVGRLEIPGLINILIVKGTDNEYYLSRAVTKKKDNRGTEFMDYRVNSNSKQINIYGHNSRTYDIPFRKLEKFLEISKWLWIHES